MTGWGSQGRESEETIIDRSKDLASGCFSFNTVVPVGMGAVAARDGADTVISRT